MWKSVWVVSLHVYMVEPVSTLMVDIFVSALLDGRERTVK
jgi:hypothetical protein